LPEWSNNEIMIFAIAQKMSKMFLLEFTEKKMKQRPTQGLMQ